MARDVHQGSTASPSVVQGPPQDFASVPPPDLYPTSDIRFVMIELGKLSVKVDRLVDDVKGHGTKIDRLRQIVAWVGGAAAVVFVLLSVAAKILPMPHLDFSTSQSAPQPSAKP